MNGNQEISMNDIASVNYYNKPKSQTERPFLKYVVCFLTRGDEILMLHRRYPPNAYMWNGVGGKIKDGETALQTCLREVLEETGFEMETLNYGGILTWVDFEIDDGGLYLFYGEAQHGEVIEDNGEGMLRWKPKSWVFSDNSVVSNIHRFGPKILAGALAQEYYFKYHQGKIVAHEVRPLPGWADIHTPIRVPKS